jgi:transcriptional regulator with XRE-family HTH domain
MRKTQAQLAFELNVRQTTIANWENEVSEPSLDELMIIIKLFGISPNEMLSTDLESGKPIGNLPEPEKPPKSNLISKANGKAMEQNEGTKGGAINLEGHSETDYWYLLEQIKQMRAVLDEIKAGIGKQSK